MRMILTIISLALLTLASFWFLRGLRNELTDKPIDSQTREIARAYQVNIQYFDANNQLQYALVSDSVIEYSNQFGSKFNKPLLTTYNNKKQVAWNAKSITATLSGDRNYVTLIDDVHLTQLPNSENPIHVDGSRMYYDAIRKLISSDEAVTIKDGAIAQRATNFTLNTESELIDFDEGIKANYQPITQP